MKSRQAKVLHRAGGASLLEHVLDAALELVPADRITVVVGHQAEEVKRSVARYGVHFALQTEQRGTGHAVLCCRDLPHHHDGRILLLYGDAPLLRAETLKGLVARHESLLPAATVITARVNPPTGYGRIVRDGNRVAAIVEEKAATPEQKRIDEINSGIYCFEAPLLWQELPRITPNPASNEIYLTDIVESYLQLGLNTIPFELEDSSEILGINTRIELAQVDRIFRERKVRELMLAGVTIERPESVTVDRRVQVGIDTVIASNTQLLGATQIGENCRIGVGAVLTNAQIADGAEIHPYSVVDQSSVGAGAQVGPFARIRMNSQLSNGARVGNFVELKNTEMGEGAKSLHLAYLGDASLGAKVNVGAGAITCNYDGVAKHRTTIESGVFIGSNATLVAPLTVEQNAFIAAGSVITKHVPADALALGRAHQLVKAQWAKKRRESRAQHAAPPSASAQNPKP